MSDDRAKDRLDELLIRRNREPVRVEEIDAQIWKEFGKEYTVMVCDFSGYTRLTKAYGIIHFLALYQSATELCKPEVESVGGIFLKNRADNLMALFDNPNDGIETAIRINKVLSDSNSGADEISHIRICIGMSHGPIIKTDLDAFGDAVNIAYKLGEDVARAGEVLLSDACYDKIIRNERGARFRFREREEIVAGEVLIGFYRMVY